MRKSIPCHLLSFRTWAAGRLLISPFFQYGYVARCGLPRPSHQMSWLRPRLCAYLQVCARSGSSSFSLSDLKAYDFFGKLFGILRARSLASLHAYATKLLLFWGVRCSGTPGVMTISFHF